MKIKIERNSNRRMAWTDKVNGYFEFLFSENQENSGYFRNDVKYFSGFSCSSRNLVQAKSTEVYPYGFRAFFDKEILEASLLIYEGAFYINASKTVGILNAVPYLKKPSENTQDALLIEENQNSKENDSVLKSENIPVWHIMEKDGIKIISCNRGIAVSAEFDFYYSMKDSDLILHVSDSGKSVSDEPFSDLGWYLTFEESEELALEKAFRLAKNRQILLHKKLIDEFLNKTSIDFGDEKFNEAVKWSRFSAWLLTTKNSETDFLGIWAGLPWFRDNWGRDTFISLCGSLLVSGCFKEAESVLLGFAGFQCLDEKSDSYGRIPNRYRSQDDVIFNTADGTLWFIRAVYEYFQYTGNLEIVKKLLKNIEIAVDAEIKRCDENGFLMHGDADSWMDARIKGDTPLSPRGDRANDIQVLWYSALKICAFFMDRLDSKEKSKQYLDYAQKVKSSFKKLFWNPLYNSFADCLPPGGYGDWIKDMRVRPNQLFLITVPQVLPDKDDRAFVSKEDSQKILEDVERELVSPFGLYTLSPDDPTFHPHHEWNDMYNKDAAYHNGTIWEWNSGPYISAAAKKSGLNLEQKPASILLNEAKMILESGCAGSWSENIHACCNKDGSPILSGTYSQAWSVAEFNRNVFQDLIGFVPYLAENKIELSPHFPHGLKEFYAELPFGNGWYFCVKAEKKSSLVSVVVEWKIPEGFQNETKSLFVNDTEIVPGKKFELQIKSQEKSEKIAKSGVFEKFAVPKKWISQGFEKHDLFTEWNGASHKKDYLFNVLLSGRTESKTSGGKNTAFLEWYFDSEEFKQKYTCTEELGVLYGKKKSSFRLWAPTARDVKLLLFADGENSECEQIVQMVRHEEKGLKGVWECSVSGNLHGKYYMFRVYAHGLVSDSADPYAKACGINGIRSMVCDFTLTNPSGWEESKAPSVKSPSDVVAYELHVADLTSSKTWNGSEENRRTFKGCAESGTTFNSVVTGFDHIKKLGVTHVQFLPIFDFRSVDEKRISCESYKNQAKFGLFNWGYDPENYACPEGSYSSNPYDGSVRITELKQMIKKFNDSGIGVIMDVVYNHVNDGVHHPFGLCVPGYYFRVEGYSGAGEDTASEHEMFARYMISTLSFWLKEYKLSGFRFDLMGLHDVNTMNRIHDALSKIKPDVLLYGEGWDMYNAGKMESASMKNALKMPFIGHFNDAIRCGIKGPINNDYEPGFIHDGSRKESVKFGIVGATEHPGVDFTKVQGTAYATSWGDKTWKSVNYTEIHDNVTLHDKLELVEPCHNDEYYAQMQKFAISLVIFAEGMPILHAGMEFLRTKQIPEDILKNEQPLFETAVTSDGKKSFFKNTYNICDRVNGLDWSRLEKFRDVSDYVSKIIAIRKEHKAFRISDAELLRKVLKFEENKDFNFPEEVLVWSLDGTACEDSWEKIVLIANPLSFPIIFSTPIDDKKEFFAVSDGKTVFDEMKKLSPSEKYEVPPKALAVFIQKAK